MLLRVSWLLTATAAASVAPSRPKVVITTLLDDFGYASASFNRPANATPWETRTPHMDAMAAEGIILRRHYVHPFCTPSRSSFLSGRLPVHVQRTNTMPDRTTAGVPWNMTSLPEMLRLAGASVDAHVVGKYDVGGATQRHSPEGRGFASSLIYFSHAVDAFTHNDYCGPGGDRATSCNCNDSFVDLWDSGAPARGLNGTGFVDDLFLARVLEIITNFNHSTGRSLWIHFNTHATHDPLQATPSMLAALSNTTNDEDNCSASIRVSATGSVYPGGPVSPPLFSCRRTYEAMTQWVDGAMGQIRGALEGAGLWNESLLVTTADNGGQLDLTYGGGSNLPLRGGKSSEWEGGVRAAAFVSGGYLPLQVRGRVETGLMHISDWMATLCGLLIDGGGGAAFCVNDTRARAAGLPQPDSLNMWPLLSGANATSPRVEVPISATALVTPRFKLLLGPQGQAGWSGELHPNASTPAHNPQAPTLRCGSDGCLFDVDADPGEHEDVAQSFPAELTALKARLTVLSSGFYSNDETAFVCAHNASLDVQKACGCDAAASVWGGFFGPYAAPAYPRPLAALA